MRRKVPKQFSAEAKDAFRQMLYHKLYMWDEALRLERSLTCEVDTGALDYLASSFGEAREVLGMDDEALVEVMQDWLSDESHARFYEETSNAND